MLLEIVFGMVIVISMVGSGEDNGIGSYDLTGDGRADHFCWDSDGGVWSDSDRGQDYCKKADYAKNIPNCVGT